jgi:hypothetical protein
MFSLTSFGQKYICNIEYIDHLSKSEPCRITLRTTLVFDSTHQGSYQETFGPFGLQISCNNSLDIIVSSPARVMSDKCLFSTFNDQFSRSFVHARAGLKIRCQPSIVAIIAQEQAYN